MPMRPMTAAMAATVVSATITRSINRIVMDMKAIQRSVMNMKRIKMHVQGIVMYVQGIVTMMCGITYKGRVTMMVVAITISCCAKRKV